jgi:ATP-dependent DNA ligase
MSKPQFIAPLVDGPFDDPDWLFEVKWDGFRVETVVDGDNVRLWTRGRAGRGGALLRAVP